MKQIYDRSKNVEQTQATPNRRTKRNPPSTTGIKGDRLYNSPEYKKALKDISSKFQSAVERKPIQPNEYTFIKRMNGAPVTKR